jgi:hypothetical protein
MIATTTAANATATGTGTTTTVMVGTSAMVAEVITPLAALLWWRIFFGWWDLDWRREQ